MLSISHLRAALKFAQVQLRDAHNAAESDDYWDRESIGWSCRSAYETLLLVANALNLEHIVAELKATMRKNERAGLKKTDLNNEQERYSSTAAELGHIAYALNSLFGEKIEVELNDLKKTLEKANYYITNPDIFGSPPQRESHVHDRIEGMLDCFYPDLEREAYIVKPLKSYRIDTGLPSIRTILEYKYLDKKQDVPKFVDQMLADSSGYHSKQWDTVLFVIYETQRFHHQDKWRSVLVKSDAGDKADVIVLSGEPRKSTKKIKRPRPGK